METHVIHKVDARNLEVMAPKIIKACQQCCFFAIDTEFTGLSRTIRERDVQTRYEAMRKLVISRSLLQLGLAFFRHEAPPTGAATDVPHYAIEVFDLLVVRKDDFSVRSSAMAFLASCGLDLNDVFRHGIGYVPQTRRAALAEQRRKAARHKARRQRGAHRTDRNAKVEPEASPPSPIVNLFKQLCAARKPLAVHNGLLDLVFLFESFIEPLPVQLPTFAHRLLLKFPRVYDTKYIEEMIVGQPVSYLLYCFHSRLRSHGRPAFSPAAFTAVDSNKRPRPADAPAEVCEQFALHGHCRRGTSCSQSHDMGDVVTYIQGHRRKRPRLAGAAIGGGGTGTGVKAPAEGGTGTGVKAPAARTDKKGAGAGAAAEGDTGVGAGGGTATSGGTKAGGPSGGTVDAHSAAFDAVATGVVFASQHWAFHRNCWKLQPMWPSPWLFAAHSPAKNRLYLVGKDDPLILRSIVPFGTRPPPDRSDNTLCCGHCTSPFI